jgi:hypothetical protein
MLGHGGTGIMTLGTWPVFINTGYDHRILHFVRIMAGSACSAVIVNALFILGLKLFVTVPALSAGRF